MRVTRISVMVSPDAKKVLDKYQKDHGSTTKDEALDGLLLEYKEMKKQ